MLTRKEASVPVAGKYQGSPIRNRANRQNGVVSHGADSSSKHTSPSTSTETQLHEQIMAAPPLSSDTDASHVGRHEQQQAGQKHAKSASSQATSSHAVPHHMQRQVSHHREIEDLGGVTIVIGRHRVPVFPPRAAKLDPDMMKPPKPDLVPEYVYGYNGQLHNHLHSFGNSEIVYCAAALGIVLNVYTNEQRFFRGHTRTVTCLAVHAGTGRAVSGQDDPKGKHEQNYICAWRISDCAEVARLTVQDRCSDAVAWSKDGQRVFALVTPTPLTERQRSERLYVWDINNPRSPMLMVHGTRERVLGMQAHYSDSARFLCFGLRHVLFFQLPLRGADKVGRKVVKHWGQSGPPQAVTCCCYLPWTHGPAKEKALACGTSDGRILVIGEENSQQEVIMTIDHSPGICLSFMMETQFGICAGGFDSEISFYDKDLSKSSCFHFYKRSKHDDHTKLRAAAVLDIKVHTDGRLLGKVVVGTTGNGLWLGHFDGDSDTPTSVESEPLVLCPHAEITALSTNPARTEEFACGTVKGVVRFFDAAARRSDSREPFRCHKHEEIGDCGGVTCLAFDHTGTVLAAGAEDGQLVMLSTPITLLLDDRDGPMCPTELLYNTRACSERITAMQWSTDGSWLAAGSSDLHVYLYRVTIDYHLARDVSPPRVESDHVEVTPASVLTGMPAIITCVQFSVDAKYILANCRDGHVQFWQTDTGDRYPHAAELRDVEWFNQWHPWQCVLGWPVAGLWSDTQYNTFSLKSAESARTVPYIAFGDNLHFVKLMRFPSTSQEAQCKSFGGHGGHVSCVVWTCDDTLLSAGGTDCTIIQWRLSDRSSHVHPEPIAGYFIPPDDVHDCKHSIKFNQRRLESTVEKRAGNVQPPSPAPVAPALRVASPGPLFVAEEAEEDDRKDNDRVVLAKLVQTASHYVQTDPVAVTSSSTSTCVEVARQSSIQYSIVRTMSAGSFARTESMTSLRESEMVRSSATDLAMTQPIMYNGLAHSSSIPSLVQTQPVSLSWTSPQRAAPSPAIWVQRQRLSPSPPPAQQVTRTRSPPPLNHNPSLRRVQSPPVTRFTSVGHLITGRSPSPPQRSPSPPAPTQYRIQWQLPFQGRASSPDAVKRGAVSQTSLSYTGPHTHAQGLQCLSGHWSPDRPLSKSARTLSPVASERNFLRYSEPCHQSERTMSPVAYCPSPPVPVRMEGCASPPIPICTEGSPTISVRAPVVEGTLVESQRTLSPGSTGMSAAVTHVGAGGSMRLKPLVSHRMVEVDIPEVVVRHRKVLMDVAEVCGWVNDTGPST